ncbi:hypothetical protein QQX09_09755 [Demequina sp. SYSU T00192]|uniref:Tetratricopeptide repeat-containing protein n=1 Tax=Demequina litoralis TaxID=3051660 RepID=A0ABT8GAI0_9MICO|nr:hypothetical protein [Demequina sp. SYSU T00192]MDN4476136.1 hypothetical protein [Demequina sp. SYSU T00192]
MSVMRRPAFLAAVATTALLALLMGFVANIALMLLRSPGAVAKLLGVLVLVLPLIAAWFLVNEWRTGITVQRMASRLEAEGRLPLHDGARDAHGRLTDEAKQDIYEVAHTGVDLDPESWAAWFHLAFAHEAVEEKAEARKALRQAAALFRAQR